MTDPAVPNGGSSAALVAGSHLNPVPEFIESRYTIFRFMQACAYERDTPSIMEIPVPALVQTAQAPFFVCAVLCKQNKTPTALIPSIIHTWNYTCQKR